MFEILVLSLFSSIVFFILKHFKYSLFFVILLSTEFYYIEIGDGIARPYHFFAVLIVLVLLRYVPALFGSKVFIALLVFSAVNVFSIIYSDFPSRAATSFLSLAANIGVAMATALILYSQRLKFFQFKRILLIVTLISISWGLSQILAYRFFGLNLALQYEQIRQINDGFGPAFRTEANTFGKYMVVPFLLFLPDYLKRQGKYINLIYLAFLVGIFINFTRSSLYGSALALILVAFWYLKRGQLGLFAKKGLKIACAVLLGIFLVTSGAVGLSDYARYKVVNFFNQEEILSGGSSSYRLNMMQLVLEDVMSNDKIFLIGKGWGQTRYYYYNREVTAGGGDVVTLLGYAGILGVLAYLLTTTMAIFSAARVVRNSKFDEFSSFAEGVFFALMGMFFVGQMAGYLIMPEFWMIIGVCIYLDLTRQKITHGPPTSIAWIRA